MTVSVSQFAIAALDVLITVLRACSSSFYEPLKRLYEPAQIAALEVLGDDVLPREIVREPAHRRRFTSSFTVYSSFHARLYVSLREGVNPVRISARCKSGQIKCKRKRRKPLLQCQV